MTVQKSAAAVVESVGPKVGSMHGGVLQCFDSIQGPDGLFPGEDIAFCRRWVEGCGGEIWSSVDEAIVHIGQENFVGQYLFKLQRGEALGPAPVRVAPPLAAEA